jgi:hypothetical protein
MIHPINEGSPQYRASMNLMQTWHEGFFMFSSAFSHPFHVDFRSVSRCSCTIKGCAVIGFLAGGVISVWTIMSELGLFLRAAFGGTLHSVVRHA